MYLKIGGKKFDLHSLIAPANELVDFRNADKSVDTIRLRRRHAMLTTAVGHKYVDSGAVVDGHIFLQIPRSIASRMMNGLYINSKILILLIH